MHENEQIRNNRIEHIYRLVDSTAKSLDKIKSMLKNLDRDDQRKSFVDVEGVTGVFDGINLVSADGKKFEVPVNYAAKSRMVVGDTLKMVEDEGKTVFKQIDKVDRKKVEGIMTKKEGKWHIISDSGTYRVSDIAADFQHAQIHDEASAFIPAKNLNVGFAALDVIKNKSPMLVANPVAVSTPTTFVKPVDKPVEKIVERPKPVEAKAPQVAAHVAPKPPVVSTPRPTTQPARPMAPRPARPAANTSVAKPAFNRDTNAAPVNGGPFKQKPPFRPAAAKKEFVEDIVRPQPEQDSAPTQPISLEDDDLR